MPGKRVQFDDETWHAPNLLARDRRQDYQELADDAFRNLLKKPATRPEDRPSSKRGERGARQTRFRKTAAAKPSNLPPYQGTAFSETQASWTQTPSIVGALPTSETNLLMSLRFV
jgi:hypothetical protein